MGFKSLIATQVQNAFRILGTDEDGLARKQSYISVGTPVYNTITRRTTSGETRYDDVPMVLVRFKIDDMDDQVRPTTDRRALIAALDLGAVPAPQDRIETYDGKSYEVVRLLSDPSESLHIAHIRLAPK